MLFVGFISKFLAGETSEFVIGFASKDTNFGGNRLGGFFDITSDHNNTDTSIDAFLDGDFDFRSRGVTNSDNTDQNWVGFKFSIFFNLFQKFVSLVGRSIVISEFSTIFFVTNSECSKSSFSILMNLVEEGSLSSGSEINNLSIS